MATGDGRRHLIAGPLVPARLMQSSIRLRLLILLVIALLPVLGMVILYLVRDFRANEARAVQSVSVTREDAIARVEVSTLVLQQVLTAASHIPGLLDDGGTCRDALRKVLELQGLSVDDLAVVQPNGHVVCAIAETSSAFNADWTEAGRVAWFDKFRSKQGFVISPDEKSDMRNPAVLTAVPVQTDGRIVGVIVGHLHLPMLSRVGMSQPHMSYWVQNDGRFRPVGVVPDDAAPAADMLARLTSIDLTTSITCSRLRIPYIYASFSVVGGNRLLIGYRAASIRAQALSQLWRQIGIIAAAFAVALSLLLLGAHVAIIWPLRRLNHAVRDWQTGGAADTAAFNDAPAELQELSRSFVKAIRSLTDREILLRGAAAQQELLMQEIHHRVKNNLQIVASLLNLQASRIRLPAAKAEFQSARDRVRALATLHRHLYTQQEVRTINLRPFLVELCDQLFQAMGEQAGRRITLDIEASELQMSSDQAVPLALIVTEAVSNALKYAFPDQRAGHVSVRLTADGSTATLVVQDDGIGMPAGRMETETGTRDGIGLQLINGFARQLNATLRIEKGVGTRYEVVLPLRSERIELAS